MLPLALLLTGCTEPLERHRAWSPSNHVPTQITAQDGTVTATLRDDPTTVSGTPERTWWTGHGLAVPVPGGWEVRTIQGAVYRTRLVRGATRVTDLPGGGPWQTTTAPERGLRRPSPPLLSLHRATRAEHPPTRMQEQEWVQSVADLFQDDSAVRASTAVDLDRDGVAEGLLCTAQPACWVADYADESLHIYRVTGEVPAGPLAIEAFRSDQSLYALVSGQSDALVRFRRPDFVMEPLEPPG
jgi:hypothetical protein